MKAIFFNILLLTNCLGVSIVAGQELDVSITTWKNNAQGAYSIIHDDFGDVAVDGIWEYADTIAYNRGITFTTGAITSACEVDRNINGYNNPYDYVKNVMIEKHGHELINHTHNHTCAIYLGWSTNCNQTEGWADLDEFSVEMDQSTTSILDNTGYQPRFFIYPFDQFSNGANDHLKTLGYIGSRSGWTSNQPDNEPYYRFGYDAYDENDFYPDDDGFFRSAVVVSVNGGEADNLNEKAQLAIDNGVWVNRELHNVGDDGWGNVPVNTYRSHMDFLKTKKESGELWVATVSEILTYQLQKLNYSVSANYITSNYLASVTFEKTDFDVVSYLAPLTFKSPITVELDLSEYGTSIKMEILQNGIQINDFTLNNDVLLINIYPSNGDLIVKNIGGATVGVKQSLIKASEVLVYPNPSKTGFHLDMGLNNNMEVFSIQIYNSVNQVIEIIDGTVADEVFGEQLKSGVYFLKIITEAGELTRKIVKL